MKAAHVLESMSQPEEHEAYIERKKLSLFSRLQEAITGEAIGI